MSGRERFLSALAGRELAFAPIVWERLAALVHQEREGWWQDPTVAGRLMGDAAALAGADAMFVLAAGEAVRRAAASGLRGDAALDGLAGTAEQVVHLADLSCECPGKCRMHVGAGVIITRPTDPFFVDAFGLAHVVAEPGMVKRQLHVRGHRHRAAFTD